MRRDDVATCDPELRDLEFNAGDTELPPPPVRCGVTTSDGHGDSVVLSPFQEVSQREVVRLGALDDVGIAFGNESEGLTHEVLLGLVVPEVERDGLPHQVSN